jgi:hypothetical protein
MYEGMPLYVKAMEESVGARKECIRIGYVLSCSVHYFGLRSDQAADEHHRFLEEKWGKDGSILTAGCMDYRFDRHFAISKAVGIRSECFVCFPCVQGAAEHCGDVQQMVQLFEKQLGAMGEFFKRGVVNMELRNYLCYAAPSFTGLELNALHPFGKELAGLLGSCEGWCTDPSDCEEWIGSSAQWSAHRSRHGEGISSKDGLHHLYLKPTMIVTVQAILSLSMASMGNCNFDLSWLDDLPAADDPKLHDGCTATYSFVNIRVQIAEVLEWQGRHKEAIRCENIIYFSTRPIMCVTCFCLWNHSFAVAELQGDFNFCVSSKVRAGRVLGRCHAALGEHALSVSAFDAAIKLASAGRFLLSEALAIRDRARAGQETGGSRLHWDERTGKQRRAEMMERMQGPREPLERLLA